ncbi:hypothetical protein [Bradyrhizobium guangzhouense]|uniref:hypothetical protein n=1 Tax=Bradyrhizobium guangzhouense TaxID=1325095 RepID=UPI001009B6BA|nr:hypothetical protein [Bradyrhizobium guangzhouense]
MSVLDGLRLDPILKMFAIDLLRQQRGWAHAASGTFDRARRSVTRSHHTSAEDSQAAETAYWNAEKAIYPQVLYAVPDDNEELAKSVEEVGAVIEQLLDSTKQLIRARNGITRYTIIDANLEETRVALTELHAGLGLLRDAISGQDEARRQIYDRVLGKKLDQLDAPYLFNIVDFLIELLAPPPADTPASAAEALALLTKQAFEIAERLDKTNVDRRFASALREYVDVLTEQNFSPIKVELFSNKLRAYLFELKDELPGFAIAEVSALLLSQEQVLRQFPAWRAFEADATRFMLDKPEIEKQRVVLDGITSETKATDGVVSEAVLDALSRLGESSHSGTTKTTTELGIWRSLENFVKTNVRFLIVATRNLQEYVSTNQYLYLKYIERLLPYLKLYVAMRENLAWLTPVLHWLEDYLKTVKKP